MSFVLCARMPVNSLPAPCAWGLGPCGHHVRLLDSWLLSPYSLTVTSQLEGIIITGPLLGPAPCACFVLT